MPRALDHSSVESGGGGLRLGQPHRSDDASRLSEGDPFFVEKVRDIVGLTFGEPPDRALVLCLSTKRARSRPWTVYLTRPSPSCR